MQQTTKRLNNSNILAVEDDEVAMSFLEAQIEDLGQTVIKASNGQDAVDILKTRYNEIDVIVMDRKMPVMDGLSAVKHIKADPFLKNIPIIMVTGADSQSEIKEGLESGVYYYLTKPTKPEMLKSVLYAATREADRTRLLLEELSKHKASFGLISEVGFTYKTLDEACNLTAFIANCYPDPERVITGIGELLVNAVEHGNAGIGYEQKTYLLKEGLWQDEIQKRLAKPEISKKQVEVTLRKAHDSIVLIVKDEGSGFNWQDYLSFDPSRATDSHGRGIAHANLLCFDMLEYNEEGNVAIAKCNVD